MRVLVLGADGFIGRQVSKVLAPNNNVFRTLRESKSADSISIDLLDKGSITQALKSIRPQIIINCAGVVENSERAVLNFDFTRNLLQVIDSLGMDIERIIICGSAAEYGIVDPKNLPVKETTSLEPNTLYGKSKVKETNLAYEYKEKYGWPIIVARIFNPIGVGMHPRLIIPGILRQVLVIKDGKGDTIEVSRLDSKRDYINVKDVALGLSLLATNKTRHDTYNLGSGHSTSNEELIDLVLSSFSLPIKPKIIETISAPEPPLAIQADITRIKSELGWSPVCTIEESIKEIVSDTRRS